MKYEVAWIEKQGHDANTRSALCRYLEAVGGSFVLEVKVRDSKLEKNFAHGNESLT